MTGDKAVELINEWLNLAKEVGDMNLNRMEYDEERYNYGRKHRRRKIRTRRKNTAGVKTATVGGKSTHGQNPLNKPQAEKPHTENPPQTKIERKIERYKKENLSKEKENHSASSVIGKIQSQIGFEFLLKEHPDDEQLLRLISRVIAEKLLSEDASITSKSSVTVYRLIFLSPEAIETAMPLYFPSSIIPFFSKEPTGKTSL